MLGRRLGLGLGGKEGIGRGGRGLQLCLGKQHMRTVPPCVGVVVVGIDGGDGSSSSSATSSSSLNSFCKDGRKINIGDCALFKPPQDSPPFIGIVRCFSPSKENILTLGVNWLYRPSEVKLSKGILLEAAPNEIFYSFHKDEIPATSLLHPCKVAFLPKGSDLPSGISSFVCRRVYDISNSCLWWLTDQDYINERQEEIDRLLHKTQVEMHATVQPNGRSPKRMNGPTSQLKSGSDCVQNSGSSFSAKGKRRERADQVSEPFKRERSSKMEDADSVLGRSESFMKHEIAKTTEKGGLVDIDGVEKLVQLMFPERGEKKVDLACRSLLAGVIASTDKLDCLNQFVQLKGLSILDEWLQEVHKGRVGDGVIPRDNDKSVEEFISVSLRALDKLPVNLHALQTCNIGKSVNHLRSHKNAEIQKKARTLVDTWKKRVEDEMNRNDAKSGSNQTVNWSARSRLPDVVPSGNKQIAGCSDAASKSSGGPLISKSASTKLVQGENACKSASVSPGSVKSAPMHPLMNASMKDHTRGSGVSSISDVPMTTSRDEKSTGSSQSHNNSQSCSSDHAKAGGIPEKEDARSSTAGSGKNLTGPSRHKKSVNGFSGSPASGREVGSGRNSSLHRGSIPEKISQSGLTSEKAVDVPAEVNSHKLIVKISSRSHSPAQNASGGSLEEQSVMNSRASSPSTSDRPDQLDPAAKEKVDCQGIVSSEINVESRQSSDLKDILMSCDDGDGSPKAFVDDELLKAGESLKRVSDALNSATLLSCREFKSGRLPDASLGSINALVESCVKLSEPSVADSVMDDVGMNLLASVAAGEMLTSETTSPAGSPQIDRSTALLSSAGNDQSKNASTDRSPAEAVTNTSTTQKTGEYGTSLTSAEEVTSGDQPEGVEAGTEDIRNADYSTKPAPLSEECLHKETKTDVSLLSELEVDDVASKMEVTKEAIETGAASKNKFVKPVTDDFKDGKKSQKSSDERHSENVEELKSDVADDPVVTNVENSANETDGKEDKKEGIALCELKFVGSSCKVLSEPPVEDKIITVNSATCKLTSSVVEEKEHASCATESVSFPSMDVPCTDEKVAFDLNEGFSADDGKYAEPVNLASSAHLYIHPLVNQLPFPSVPTILPAPIPPAAAKGPFVPPNDFIRAKVELGWKGSAATSAFRPAEPRKVLEMQLLGAGAGQDSDAGSSRRSLHLLNIDLNVPDEGTVDDAESMDSIMGTDSLPKANCERTHNLASASSRGSGCLNLDLNQMDDATDIWSSSANNNHRLDVSLPSVKLSSVVRPSGTEAGSKWDFDLNDGPVLDDISAEPSTSGQQARNSLLSQQPVSTLNMNNSDLGSFSTWFPPGSTFSAVTIPSILPNRGDQPLPVVAAGGQPRMMGPSGGGISFTHDVYRGSVLSSSPAVSFPSTPFQYNVFPYGRSCPLPPASFSARSTTYIDPSSGGRLCFPPVHSQILGASGAVTSPYIRPYVVSLQDGSSTFDNSKKWSRPGLDLNTGPGGSEAEGKEDTSSLAPRHFSIASSQALTEDQARMYQVTSGVLKRKEPEGGWDSYKQSSFCPRDAWEQWPLSESLHGTWGCRLRVVDEQFLTSGGSPKTCLFQPARKLGTSKIRRRCVKWIPGVFGPFFPVYSFNSRDSKVN